MKPQLHGLPFTNVPVLIISSQTSVTNVKACIAKTYARLDMTLACALIEFHTHTT